VIPLKQTPSQTVGPFFSLGLIRDTRPVTAQAAPHRPQHVLVDDGVDGERISVEGLVFDGAGAPIDDALIELWQADAMGRYGGLGFMGFGRAATTADGTYTFETIKPGSAQAPDGGTQAPHLNVTVFARGMLLHAFTRMYFSDDDPAARDPLLSRVDPARRQTLIGQRSERDGRIVYRWDIHLQGDRETVFFDA
jgi:protocatechuate 3,4-dioxygenase alpha subunit